MAELYLTTEKIFGLGLLGALTTLVLSLLEALSSRKVPHSLEVLYLLEMLYSLEMLHLLEVLY